MPFFKESRTVEDEESQALMSDAKGLKKSQSQESHLRSVLKGITWRFVATSTTMSIAYGLTGKFIH